MEQAIQIFNRVLPILLLILLGSGLRRYKFLSPGTVDDLRKVVVTIALPAVLFVTFLQIELKLTYLAIFVVIFVLCILLLGMGFLLKARFAPKNGYFPFLMTGFEYGMLGVSLFGGAYGLENLGTIAVLALGHEIFIWFIFLAFLLTKRDGLQNSRQLVGAFFKSPVILAILLGILFNLLGMQELLRQAPLSGGVMSALQFLGNLVVPLILLIVGYSIQFDRQGVKSALPAVLLRLFILIPLALAMNFFFIRNWLGLEPIFEAALFTLLVLPPPFIIPLYMRAELVEERHYVNNVLALYTLFSISIYIVYFIVYQGL